MGPKYLEELDRDLQLKFKRMKKRKNKCPCCDGILAETWKKFIKNKKVMGILMDMFNKTLESKTIHKNKGKLGEPKNYSVLFLSVAGKFFSQYFGR
jgi:hypothetical protein